VNFCRQVNQATVGLYLLLTSTTWKSVTQPVTWMACPVLFSTTTRPDIDDPAVIVRDGNTTRADIGAEEWRGVAGSVVCGFAVGCAATPWGRRDGMCPPLEHPATRSQHNDAMTSDLISI